ncbi:ferredoxin [Streptomyces diacarni]|uniref:Ferredoxin n=2 Tax=Streptomyces TaxID=1883 RepID=A0A367EC18_9ACTN|nr:MULTISPECIES: ferredoxin [Streptomyces]RCG15606.1 ferredoxin [Streptomyces diacarni]UNS95191.1 ferredoxin [Streptomyces tubbatahanensis]
MRVEVDQPKCVASGQCVLAAPDVFDQDDDGIVVTLNDRPDTGLHDDVREAAALCPAAVISLVEK